MRKIKGTLPNVLTMINLSLGVIAILMAVSEPQVSESGKQSFDMLIYASLLVMIAALTDRFDGKVARMLDATSELGKELDSLSDLISFGVAPVIIAWKISFDGLELGPILYLLAIIFPIAGAYRLARYNVTVFDNVFRGIPITLAGAFLTIDNIFNTFSRMRGQYTHINTAVTAGLIIMLSYLMVSKIRFKKI